MTPQLWAGVLSTEERRTAKWEQAPWPRSGRKWEELGFQLEPGVCAMSAILQHFNLNSGLDLLEGVHGAAAWTGEVKVESLVGSFGYTGLQGLGQVAFWVLSCRDEWVLWDG